MLELEEEVRRLESALQISPADAYRAPTPIHHSDGEATDGEGKQQPDSGRATATAYAAGPSISSTPVDGVKATTGLRSSDEIGQLMSFPSLRSGASSDAENGTSTTPATAADPPRTRNARGRNLVATAALQTTTKGDF